MHKVGLSGGKNDSPAKHVRSEDSDRQAEKLRRLFGERGSLTRGGVCLYRWIMHI